MDKNLSSYFKIMGAVLTIAIGAQLTVDIGPIPITGQTLCILIWAFFLRAKESLIALLVYLALGFIGLPVFANGDYGINKLFGGSGGFLIGFVLAAVVVSYFNQNHNFPTFLNIISLTTLGTILIMGCGVTWLAIQYGFEKGLAYGFLPFWQGAIVKIVMGSFLVWGINHAIDTRRG